MERLKINIPKKENIDEMRQAAYLKVIQDEECVEFIEKYHLSKEQVLENMSKFLMVYEEKQKCAHCLGISQCEKNLKGFSISLQIDEDTSRIDLRFTPCKEKQKVVEGNSYFIQRDFDEEFLMHPFKDVANIDYLSVRKQAIVYMKELCKSPHPDCGVYLYGNRMVGKTFMLSLLAVDLAKKNHKTVAFLDVPSRIKELNDLNFTNKEELNRLMNQYIQVDYLFLDDFGNEYKNEFIRDTILYPLLSERYRLRKLTCFGSCYTPSEISSMYALREFNSPKAKQLKMLIEGMSKMFDVSAIPFRE